MPIAFEHLTSRRAFLRTALLGGAGVVAAGCRTIPGASASPAALHLALLADTHIPADRANSYRGFRPWENLRAVAPQVAAARPEGVVLCGDAARLDGQEADYRELRGLLAPLAGVAPVYIGLGNHDHRANFLKVFAEHPVRPAAVSGRHVLVMEHPVVRLIVLDSLFNVNQTPGLLGRAQRHWLMHQLPRLADRPVVLCVHHTLGDGDGELLDADRLFALVAPHRHVKAIVYGHSHVWAVIRRGPLHLINLPAVGYNFSDDQPVGWVEARFTPAGVALTLRALAGNRAGDGRTWHVAWT